MLIDSFDIDRPYCNKEISISLDSVGETVKCPYCNKEFETSDNGIIAAAEEAEGMIDDFLSDLL